MVNKALVTSHPGWYHQFSCSHSIGTLEVLYILIRRWRSFCMYKYTFRFVLSHEKKRGAMKAIKQPGWLVIKIIILKITSMIEKYQWLLFHCETKQGGWLVCFWYTFTRLSRVQICNITNHPGWLSWLVIGHCQIIFKIKKG